MANTTLRLPDVPDILHHVFSYLDPIHCSDREISTPLRSLTMVARTCRGFSGPALDVLWKCLPDDRPLVNLLCAIGIADREHKRDNPENCLTRAWPPEGFDTQYVSIYNMSNKASLNMYFPGLAGHWRSTPTSWLASFRGVRYARPRHSSIRLRWPGMVQSLGTTATCYRRRSYFTAAGLRGVL